MRIRGRVRHGLLDRHDLFSSAPPLLHSLQEFFLGANGFRGGELPRGVVLLPGYKLELPRGQAGFHAGADLPISGFAHTAPQGIAEESALVGDGLALEAALAGKGHGLPRGLLCFLGNMLRRFFLVALPRAGHHMIGLIAELSGELAMRRKHSRAIESVSCRAWRGRKSPPLRIQQGRSASCVRGSGSDAGWRRPDTPANIP